MSQEFKHAIDRIVFCLEEAEAAIDDAIYIAELNGEHSAKARMDEIIEGIKSIYFSLQDIVSDIAEEDNDDENSE